MTSIKKYTFKKYIEEYGLPDGYIKAEEAYYQRCYKERAEYNKQKLKDYLEKNKQVIKERQKKYYQKRKKAKQEKPFNTL